VWRGATRLGGACGRCGVVHRPVLLERSVKQ
jgi:hypothetical protein